MFVADSSVPCRRRRTRMLLAAGVALLSAGAARADDTRAATYPAANSPEMRVATVGYRLGTADVGRCARLMPVSGLVLHELGAYAPETRTLVAAEYGLGDGFGVLGVVRGSAADRAGIIAGDEIVAVANTPTARLMLPALGPRASFGRIEAFVDLLAKRLAKGPLALQVRHGPTGRSVELPSQPGCAAYVTLVPGSTPDAWSDARYAAVTQGLARVAGDDELAFALAHEMAHVMLSHAAESHGLLGLGGKRSQERETAADRLGIALAVAAGYDPAGADALLKRLARSHAPGISLSHPSIRTRIDALHEEVARSARARALARPSTP